MGIISHSKSTVLLIAAHLPQSCLVFLTLYLQVCKKKHESQKSSWPVGIWTWLTIGNTILLSKQYFWFQFGRPVLSIEDAPSLKHIIPKNISVNNSLHYNTCTVVHLQWNHSRRLKNLLHRRHNQIVFQQIPKAEFGIPKPFSKRTVASVCRCKTLKVISRRFI